VCGEDGEVRQACMVSSTRRKFKGKPKDWRGKGRNQQPAVKNGDSN